MGAQRVHEAAEARLRHEEWRVRVKSRPRVVPWPRFHPDPWGPCVVWLPTLPHGSTPLVGDVADRPAIGPQRRDLPRVEGDSLPRDRGWKPGTPFRASRTSFSSTVASAVVVKRCPKRPSSVYEIGTASPHLRGQSGSSAWPCAVFGARTLRGHQE